MGYKNSFLTTNTTTKTCPNCQQTVSSLMRSGECMKCWENGQEPASAPTPIQTPVIIGTIRPARQIDQGNGDYFRGANGRMQYDYLTADEGGQSNSRPSRGTGRTHSRSDVVKIGLGRYQCSCCRQVYQSGRKAEGTICRS